MAGIQALILAAGRGSRLGAAGQDVPKCLLEIGRRRLIEHQLDALADAGVGPVCVVVGYGADEIRELVGIRAEYVVNTRWEQTNSLYSFWLARHVVGGDVMILNSDVLFAPEIVGRLVDVPGDAVAIDTSSTLGREQMKVASVDGRLAGMSKDMPPDRAIGENVGILKLTADTAVATFERAGRLITDGGENKWLGAAIKDIAGQHELKLVDVSGLPWTEIDFPVDLARARKEIWPAIERGSYRRRRLSQAVLWLFMAVLLMGAVAAGALLPGLLSSSEWDTVAIENLEPVRVNLGEHSQEWWLLREGEVADIRVVPGEEVRVESRLLDPASEREPYVLEVLLDGKRLDWFKETTRPSGKATHPDWIVGHKRRFRLEIPEDTQSLEIRLVAPPATACLVRVRYLASDSGD